MEHDFMGLGLFASSSTTTTAAADIDGGSAAQQALASEAWPRFASAPPPSVFQRHADAGVVDPAAPFAPNGVVAGRGRGQAYAPTVLVPPPPQDAGGFFAASARGSDGLGLGMPPTAVVAAGAGPMNVQGHRGPVHHGAAAITAPRSTAPAPAAHDHSTAKVTITCASGTQLVLDNVPIELVEQFVLSVGNETGAAATQHALHPEPTEFSSRAQLMALWGLSDAQDGDIMPNRAASLVRFLDKRKKRHKRC
ncbi:hypothetical protein EJB05_19888 [Eragrostis curvula]|uniref:Uncharacterized protein n=1 Tax=Eragrostis curvula TaxID=38414 RepID=A0A5J9UYJ5_9POAL|nr:hypothetical protein EJB05_19888 [Eragrostis curvula]